MKSIVIVVMILFFGPVHSGQAQSPDSLKVRLLKGIRETLRQEYAAAESTFRALSLEYPDHPGSFLYWAGVLPARAADYSELLNRRMFDSLLEVSSVKAKKLLARRETLPEGLFYAGSVQSYESFVASESGEWFRAVSKGIAAVSKLSQALANDSALADCYAAIGTYNYWKSRKTHFLSWLPFVSDDRAEGINQLRIGFREGTYNRYLSASSLVIVLIDAGEYAGAIDAANVVLSEFPTNRHFLQAKARAYEKWGHHEEAIAEYGLLLDNIQNDGRSGSFSALHCHVKLAELNHRVNRPDRALIHLRAIRNFSATSFPAHMRKSGVEKLEEGAKIEQLIRMHSTGSR